jgi:hypothetical protein
MLNSKEIQKRIVEIIRKRGPSLPVQLAKELNLSSLFISAFLSELLDNKEVKISSLKVGASPLYFLEGQEEQLEKFSNYLNSKEKEAFLLIKTQKALKDSELEPAIRVALKQMKDFAENFRKDNEIYWKYVFVSQKEIEDMFYPRKEPIAQIIEIKKEGIIEKKKIETKREAPYEEIIEIKKEIPKEKPVEKKRTEKKLIEKPIESKPKKPQKQLQLEFQNPLVVKPQLLPKKQKEKSEFVLNVIDFLNNSRYEIIEEKYHKSKEYLALVKINFELGPITFLTLAKNKKVVSEQDLIKTISDAQKIPLPALFLSTGDLSKKAKEFQEKYHSILKFKKIM